MHQVIVTMSIQPFLFELTYPPGEELSRSQEEDEEEGGELDEDGSQIGVTQLKIMQRLLAACSIIIIVQRIGGEI